MAARRELLLSVAVWARTGLMLFAQLVSCAPVVQLVRQTVTVKMHHAPRSASEPNGPLMADTTAVTVLALVVPVVPLLSGAQQPVMELMQSVPQGRDVRRARLVTLAQMEETQLARRLLAAGSLAGPTATDAPAPAVPAAPLFSAVQQRMPVQTRPVQLAMDASPAQTVELEQTGQLHLVAQLSARVWMAAPTLRAASAPVEQRDQLCWVAQQRVMALQSPAQLVRDAWLACPEDLVRTVPTVFAPRRSTAVPQLVPLLKRAPPRRRRPP
jgi:hypothetical protein